MKNYALDRRDPCVALRKAIARQGAVKVETLYPHVHCIMKGQVQVFEHSFAMHSMEEEERGS